MKIAGEAAAPSRPGSSVAAGGPRSISPVATLASLLRFLVATVLAEPVPVVVQNPAKVVVLVPTNEAPILKVLRPGLGTSPTKVVGRPTPMVTPQEVSRRAGETAMAVALATVTLRDGPVRDAKTTTTGPTKANEAEVVPTHAGQAIKRRRGQTSSPSTIPEDAPEASAPSRAARLHLGAGAAVDRSVTVLLGAAMWALTATVATTYVKEGDDGLPSNCF